MLKNGLNFFYHPESSQSKQAWLSCGSVYRSLAVALADCVLGNVRTLPQLTRVMKLYAELYPQWTQSSGVNTPSAQFKHFLHQVPAHAFLNQLAHTLYYLTLKDGPHLTVAHAPYMLLSTEVYDSTYLVEQNAFPVIAEQLALEIVCHHASLTKPLPEKRAYKPLSHTAQPLMPVLMLRKQDSHFQVQVRSPELFSPGLLIPEQPYENKVLEQVFSSHVDEIRRALQERYEKNTERLTSMYTANDMTLEDLKAFYSEMPSTQRVYDSQILMQRRCPELIIDSLARASAFYHQDEDLLFARIDELQAREASMNMG